MRGLIAAVVGFVVIASIVVLAMNAERILDRVAPFDFDRPPGISTSLHLQLFRWKPERCLSALTYGRVDYRSVPAKEMENGCDYGGAVSLQQSGVRYGSRILLQCPAMAALILWERQVLGPAAERYGQKLTAVRHLGTYSCRNTDHRREGRRSEHATANAIDIAGFTFSDGSSISVAKDWNDDGAKGRFLHEVRDGACRAFNVVLSPDYNAAHRSHFHFDIGGGWVICR
jgi:hypothetical protein